MGKPLVHNNQRVSSESELLIRVNEHDQEIGQLSKADCHDGHGLLHRAFSLFVFNPKGELLLQQRGDDKRLWPGYWANSCCSHPRAGETLEIATQRRLQEELGMTCELMHLYHFIYQADFGDLGAEHELCHVFIGQTNAPVNANPTEIANWRFVAPADLDREINENPERFTPWLKMEWQRLRADFNNIIDGYQ